MRRLLLATGNPHKVTEMSALLGDVPWSLITPRDLGLSPTVAEPYKTYRENAMEKVRAYAQASGEWVLADDSGLEIDAMQGEPGVDSANFGGTTTPYPERFALIESRLHGVLPERMTARYRCLMALAHPTDLDHPRIVEGTVEGRIVFPPRGTHGFGYDPIFYVSQYDCTMAELDPAVKDRISHRGNAARQMAIILRELAHQLDEEQV